MASARADTSIIALDRRSWSDRIDAYWASTGDWVQAHAPNIALSVLAGIAIYLALQALRRWALGRAARSDPASHASLIWRVVCRTSRWVLLIVSIRLVAGYANPPALVWRTIEVLFTIAVVYQVAIWVREITLNLIRRRAGMGDHETLENAMSLISLLVTVAVFLIASVVVLDNLGVNVTGLVAGLGIGGIAIGLAAQGIFSDLFAALAVIFDKPFRRGETIGFEGTTATVETIGLKSTRLRSVTGEEVIISNAKLLDLQIVNYTRLNRRRVRFVLNLVYQLPVETARRVPAMLKEIVEAHEAVFIRAGLTNFGSSSLDFTLDFDVMSDNYDIVSERRHSIGLAIVERFAAEGVGFAYPTQTSFTAAPDGTMIMPYPQAMPVFDVEPDSPDAAQGAR